VGSSALSMQPPATPEPELPTISAAPRRRTRSLPSATTAAALRHAAKPASGTAATTSATTSVTAASAAVEELELEHCLSD